MAGGDNPWQRRQKPAAARAVSFTEIISDEMEQKATLVKLTNKPLHLIQVNGVILGVLSVVITFMVQYIYRN